MEIHFDSTFLQFAILLFTILFAFLAWKRTRFAALLFPIILPLYLIKLYFHSSFLPQITNYKSQITPFLNFINSLFTPPYQQTPVLRPDFGGTDVLIIPTNLLEILLITFLIINWRLIWRSINSLSRSLVFFIFLLLFSSVLSTAFAINTRVALGGAKSWFFLPVLLFFAFLPLLKDSAFRQKFLHLIAFSGIIISLTGLVFFVENILTYDGRLAGIFLSPNHLAMALAPGILAMTILIQESSKSQVQISNTIPNSKLQSGSGIRALGFGIWDSRFGIWDFIRHWLLGFEISKRIIYLIIFILGLSVLYLTYSYGAWLALLITVLFLLSPLLREASQRDGVCETKKLLPYCFILTLLLAALTLSQLGNPKLAHILNGDYYSSFHSRIMIWRSALEISKDYWLFGVGADNFQQAYLEYQSRFSEPYLEWSAPMPHNIFLAFQTQLGILGLISFVALVILALLHAVNNKKGKQGLKIEKFKLISNFKFQILNFDPLTFWALSYLIYTLIHGFIDTPYFKNDLAIFFWFALAAIWTARSTHKAGYASPNK